MRYFGVATFGLLGLATTLMAIVIPYLGLIFVLLALPFWLLFLVYLLRSLRR